MGIPYRRSGLALTTSVVTNTDLICEGAYYRDASSVDSLLAVRVPLFAINAEDDPVSIRSITRSQLLKLLTRSLSMRHCPIWKSSRPRT
jgi:hypothetical protein